MTHHVPCLGFVLLATLAACHSRAEDPAPPVTTYGIVPAAPGARGARAAGTDAAPPPPSDQDLADPSAAGPSEVSDAGSPNDAGPALPPDSGAGVAL